MTGPAQTDRPFARRLATLRTGTAMPAALVLVGLACAGLPGAAHAQGFNGTVASSTGVAVNAGNTDVTVLGQEGIITWNAAGTAPTATNVDFLPAGGSVLFHDSAGSSSGSFTVLNRVIPTYTDAATGATSNLAATISLSGTVSSTISVPNATGGFNTVQGGNVWFYSPYGIIANGTSQFNVGSLLLTTSDIDTSNGGSLYLSSPAGQKIGFLQATQPGSSVKILSGAQINATGDPTVANSAYVGVFAPRIEQGGAISSDGMTALVAGEAGTITFNLGLIDVAVTTGTTDPNGIVHTGTTGGPASTGEPQTIALVAMPQNAALTMLLSGSIGYTPAAVGVTDGSAVVLTAGYDAALPAATLAAGYGNIAIDNAVFTNQLTANATGAIDVSSTAAGLTDFQGNVQLSAGKAITLTANAGQEIRAANFVFLSSLLPNQAPDITLAVTGATAANPTDGLIDIGNQLSINANASPDFAAALPAIGANNIGGTITLAVSGGTLSAVNGISLTSSGSGASATDQGGMGTGGNINISASNKGTISTGSLFVSAPGYGGTANGSAVTPTIGVGGDGKGGTVIISDGDTVNGFGTLAIGSANIDAQGFGSSGVSTSGSAFGGKIGIAIGNAESWSFLGANASASNGNAQQFTTSLGNATGQVGGIALTVSGGGSLSLSSASLQNNVYMNGGSTTAHSGQAGDVAVLVDNGGSLIITNGLAITANAGPPIDSGLPAVAVAPTMTGGNVSLIADTNGSITVGSLTATANATAFGAGTTGGLASGGSATVGAQNGGSISLTLPTPSTVSAEAYGGVGPAPSDANGGTALVYVSDGTISDAGASSLLVSGSALSGGVDYQFSLAGIGFNATGNSAVVEVRPGTAGTGKIAIATIDLRAQGDATVESVPNSRSGPLSFTATDIVPISGNGGAGTGGLAEFRVFGGTLQAGTLTAWANGTGGTSGFNGAGLPAFVSGDGTGGKAFVTQTAGSINAGTVTLNAIGHGGGFDAIDINSGVLPVAGTGFGGIARVTLDGGTTVLTGALALDGGAIGGIGSGTSDTTITGGNGGAADASGGIAELLMSPGSTALLTAPSVTLSAGAQGGAGGVSSNVSITGTSGNGGAATAGTARFTLADGGLAIGGTALALADATGGAGNTGGNAVAGTAGFALVDTVAAPSNGRDVGGLLLSATPTGGAGASAATNGGTTAGNTLFTVKAATVATALTINGDFTATAPGTTAPVGDGFTGDFGAIPVTITGNALISTPRDVTMTVAAGGGLAIGGTLTINGRTIASSGAGVLAATGNVAVNATAAINLGGLSSGGTTLLVAQDPVTSAFGPVHVGDLNSVGLVTVQSGAFDAASSGALSFANSFATVGDFIVTTAGNLDVANISAGGNVSLTSTGGSTSNSGTVSGNNVTLGAGANVGINGTLVVPSLLTVTAGGVVTAAVPVNAGSIDITGTGGITIATLLSLSNTGATNLQASGGAIVIGDLASAGPVTVSGQSAQIGSSGALTIASATSTVGDLSIQTVDGLAVTTASSAGNLTLGSSAGPVTGTGTVSAIGNTAIAGFTGITLNVLTSGGTTDLQGPTGAVTVSDLASVGAVTVAGSAITLGSTRTQALLITSANANAGTGAITVTTPGNLTVGDALTAAVSIAGGAISLTSTGGSIHELGRMLGASEVFSAGTNIVVDGLIGATGPGTTGNFTATAGGTFTMGAGGNIGVGNNLAITATGGISATTLTGLGTAVLQSSGGAITGSNLSFTGGISLTGQSAAIVSPGPLLVNSATTTVGALSLQAGSILSTGLLSAAGNASLTGVNGITLTGLSSGGTTGLLAANGAITITDLASAGAVTASGQSLTIGSTGALNFASATSTAGNVAVTTAGNLGFTALNAAGAVSLTSTGGTVSAPAITATGPVSVTGAALTIGSPGTLTFGTILATTGAASVTTVGDLTIGAASAGGVLTLTSTGGQVRNTGVLSGNGVTLNALTGVLADGAINAGTGALTVAAGGAFAATTPLIQANGIAITAPLGITAPALNSSGGTRLTATGGAIGGSGGTTLLLNSGSPVDLLGLSIDVSSTNALAINSAQATAGGLTLSSAGGTLNVGTASATGNIALTAGGGNLVLTSGSAGGAIALSAPLGTITAQVQAGGLIDAQGQAVTITSPGVLQFGLATATAGDFTANAVGGLSFGSVSASGAFNATTGGLFALTGTAFAATIAVNSGDIQIGTAGQLGVRGLTGGITLSHSGSTAAFIGTAAPGTGWRLDAAEALRLFADQSIRIVVNPPAGGGAAADVVLGSMTLSYGPAGFNGPSPNLGAGGTFAIVTPGRIAVSGAVALTTGAVNDLFSLSAGTIDLIGDTGSIALFDARGGLSGTLNLAAGTIRAETAAAFAATAAGGSIDAISARLDQNDGVLRPGGYFQADAITVSVANTFLVQNTGATTLLADRRGFTANSLAITTLSPTAGIAINGVLLDPKGALIAGLDTQQSVLINGVAAATATGGFWPLSTINGCVIGLDCTVPVVVIAPSGPIIDILPKPPVAGGPDPALNLPIVQFGSPPLLNSPPMIDEPVTGVGNDDLWQPQCGAATNCHG